MEHFVRLDAGDKVTFVFDGSRSDDETCYIVDMLQNMFPGQKVQAVFGCADVVTAGHHRYLSTACQHQLHARCRLECKFCNTDCGCHCHPGNEDA